MRRVANYAACRHVGDFYWKTGRGDRRSLSIALPTGGDNWVLATLPVGARNAGPFWQWDGDLERPTLRPSVHTVGIWHGWVRSGFLVEAR